MTILAATRARACTDKVSAERRGGGRQRQTRMLNPASCRVCGRRANRTICQRSGNIGDDSSSRHDVSKRRRRRGYDEGIRVFVRLTASLGSWDEKGK